MLRNLVVATLLSVAIGGAGCNTCRQATHSWFNRGDKCDAMPPVDCAPGSPRAMMMLPSTPQVLPGPIEISPQP